MTQVLLVEDNRAFATTLKANLEREGYDVTVAGDGIDGLRLARENRYRLLILDLMLPGLGGLTLLQRLRDEGRDTPVLIMTALGTEEEKLRGFGIGADDYVVKPCGLREIVARVRALLKRAPNGGGAPRTRMVVGDLVVDFAARTVVRGGSELGLRAKEFDLFAALLRRRGQVVTRAELLREVWGYADGTRSRTVETHLANLRDRLDDDPYAPRYVRTVRGVGYRVESEPGE